MMPALNQIISSWAQWATEMAPQFGVVFICVLVLDCLLARRVWPELLSALWVLVFVRLVLPPSLALPTGLAWYHSHHSTGNTPSDLQPSGWIVVLFSIWLTGVLFFLITAVRRYRRQRRELIESSSPARAAWLLALTERAAVRLAIPRPPIRIADSISSPLVVGIWRPVIILPRHVEDGAASEQVEMALWHECVHIRRRDALTAMLCQLVQILYWPNPLLWYAGRRLAELREIGCDRQVVELIGRTDIYRRSLAEWALNGAGELAATGHRFLGRRSQVLRRLQWLDRPVAKSSRWKTFATGAVIVILSVCLLPHTPALRASNSPRLRPASAGTTPNVEGNRGDIDIQPISFELQQAQDQIVSDPSDAEGCLQRRYLVWSMLAQEPNTNESYPNQQGPLP